MAALCGCAIDRHGVDALIERELSDAAGDLPRALRNARRELMLAVMERDLAGKADLAEVTLAMSTLAEAAIRLALAAATAELAPRFGTPHGAESIDQCLRDN